MGNCTHGTHCGFGKNKGNIYTMPRLTLKHLKRDLKKDLKKDLKMVTGKS